jgi:transposase InsO family protein
LGVLFAVKLQTQETLKGFLRRAQNEFGLRIKKIRSDNGTEFKNSQIEVFLKEEGIKHEFSSPYKPAFYSIIQLYLHRILKKTSYELLTGKKPNVSYLESLGVNALFLLKEVENQNLLLRL